MDVGDPQDVPVYEDADVRDLHYYRAEANGEPYLAVERYEEGYAVTFDLLPAGAQLAAPARTDLRDELVAAVEGIVGDDASPETELSHNLGPSMGSVATFEEVATAKSVAVRLAGIVLEEANWEPHQSPADAQDFDPRQN